jgi:2Fe-2S ferredoxin
MPLPHAASRRYVTATQHRPLRRRPENAAGVDAYLSCPVTEERNIELIVTDRDGEEHRLEALEGWRAMEVIRDWGLPIKAECGGACACGTCHVVVDEAWLAKLPEPTDEELDKLDELPVVEPASRLSCQILVSEALDGLRLTLAPETE